MRRAESFCCWPLWPLAGSRRPERLGSMSSMRFVKTNYELNGYFFERNPDQDPMRLRTKVFLRSRTSGGTDDWPRPMPGLRRRWDCRGQPNHRAGTSIRASAFTKLSQKMDG